MSLRLRCALAALTASAALGCRAPPPGPEEPPPPSVTLHGVRLQHFRDSQLASQGTAEVLTYRRGVGDLAAQKAQLTLAARPEPPGAVRDEPIDIRATRVEGNMFRRQAVGEQGVTATRDGGPDGQWVARTERVHYDGVRGRATGDRPLTVEGPAYWLWGKSFAFDVEPQELALDGGVEMRVGGAR
jgi:hypothetical protein